MHQLRARLAGERGMTLIEVMVAAFVLTVAVLGTVSLIDRANVATGETKSREAATNLARELIEGTRSLDYPAITQTDILDDLNTLPGLQDPSGMGDGYQLTRRGTVFTVTAQVCSIDDGQDGYGVHDTGGSFCNNNPPSAKPDRNPDDYKKVTLTLAWTIHGQNRSVTQTTLINNPGSIFGPAIKTLTTSSPTPMTTQTVQNITISVTTTYPAVSVNWYLDGVLQGAMAGSGTGPWTATWALGKYDTNRKDGVYVISAQAFDSKAQSGQSRALTYVIDRDHPLAVQNLLVGKNGSVVDMDWDPSPERDVTGYSVFRVDPGGDTLICDKVKASSCQDTNPFGSTATPSYYVRAYDSNIGNWGPGDATAPVQVVATNNPPNPPTGFAGARNSAGDVTLVWSAANPPDPDTGDKVAYYRIYRDGQTYADRYATTPSGTATSWTDTNTGNTTHTYSITAVDTHLAESTIVGPVTK